MEIGGKDCEASCYFFAALSDEQKLLNAKARAAARRGVEPPGYQYRMCGDCEKIRLIYSFLDEKAADLIVLNKNL